MKAKPRISQSENTGNNLGFHCLLFRQTLFHKNLTTEDYYNLFLVCDASEAKEAILMFDHVNYYVAHSFIYLGFNETTLTIFR